MPVTFIPVLNSKPDASGEYRIYLKITMPVRQNRPIRRYLPLIYTIPRKAWNSRQRNVRSSYPSSDQINQYLTHKINLGKAALANAEINHTDLNPEQLLQIIKQENPNASMNMIDWLERTIKEKFPPDLKYSSFTKHMVTFNRIKKFSLENPLYFTSLTIDTLDKYKHFVQRQGKHPNTVSLDLRRLKTFLHWAEQKKLLKRDDNPFHDYRITWQESEKEALSRQELSQLQEVELSDKQHMARNFFLLMYYCWGMRSGDMFFLKWSSVGKGRIRYRMQKTGTLMTIPISEPMAAILREQKAKQHNGYVWPYIDEKLDYKDQKVFKNEKGRVNSQVNKLLAFIRKRLEIRKKLTHHIARHTFAYHTYLETKDIYLVKNRLAHSNVKDTEKYLRSLGVHGMEEVGD